MGSSGRSAARRAAMSRKQDSPGLAGALMKRQYSGNEPTTTAATSKSVRHVRRLAPARFRTIVEEQLAALPDEFARRLDNVVVHVEEEPSDEDLAALGLRRGDELLGLYHGTPQGARDGEVAPLPDRIVVYRRPTLRRARNRHEVRQIVFETLLHEIGHHFGLEEEQLPF